MKQPTKERQLKSEIPSITDPLGRYWHQPDLGEIAVDGKHAVMTEDSLKKLHDYSHSIPTGTYEGKMWRRRWIKGKESGWLLGFMDAHPEPNKVYVCWREILVV